VELHDAREDAEAEVLADRPVTTASLPSGLVTFVLTDIEGSTRLLRRLGEAYEPVLERHRQLLRSAWAMFDGQEVDVEGDGCLVAFAEPLSAMRACAEAQRRLAVEPWGPAVEVRVRIGIHRGLASPRGHSYVALAVHQLSRVMACAHGGQVLLTDDVAGHLPVDDRLWLVPMGHYRIRDFDTPVRIHQLGGPGLAGSFPALRALPADKVLGGGDFGYKDAPKVLDTMDAALETFGPVQPRNAKRQEPFPFRGVGMHEDSQDYGFALNNELMLQDMEQVKLLGATTSWSSTTTVPMALQRWPKKSAECSACGSGFSSSVRMKPRSIRTVPS
jgi:class 3 adenylate cyclase